MAQENSANGDAPWATQAEFTPRHLPLGEQAVPSGSVVHLWYFNLDKLWQPLAVALGDDNEEATQKAGLSMPQLRFLRRFYLRMLLGAYLGVPGKDVVLSKGHRGKPILDPSTHGRDLHFSLAKSGDRLLIGITGESELGVDLELKDRSPRHAPALAKRFFTEHESDAVSTKGENDRDAEFMRIWACKEAVAKASGHGIANRFVRFSVEAPETAGPQVTCDPDHPPESWRLALLVPEAGYLAAVAAQQSDLCLETFRVEPG